VALENKATNGDEMNIKKMIEVMQAFEDGAKIEVLCGEEWEDTETPSWNWAFNKYRVKV